MRRPSSPHEGGGADDGWLVFLMTPRLAAIWWGEVATKLEGMGRALCVLVLALQCTGVAAYFVRVPAVKPAPRMTSPRMQFPEFPKLPDGMPKLPDMPDMPKLPNPFGQQQPGQAKQQPQKDAPDEKEPYDASRRYADKQWTGR